MFEKSSDEGENINKDQIHERKGKEEQLGVNNNADIFWTDLSRIYGQIGVIDSTGC